MKLAVAVACALALASACHGLQLGYYKQSCPRVEAIVRDEVKKFVYKDAGIGAGLIRLVFHDCFVEVCHIAFLHCKFAIHGGSEINVSMTDHHMHVCVC